jgi:Glycosyl transferase family 2
MSINHPDPLPSNPLFSIIIPLEFHRGQWERCWQGWNTQTVERSAYEVILAVPPDFRKHILLNEISADHLEFSSSSHDIDLCAAGAAKARGKYLIFTEAHCWPKPDVLEHCLEAINANPDWAGFSCLSVPIIHNRLSQAEAHMYMADIEHAMHVHPWRKILDQCFVTKREAYEDCGGFKSGLGHFAEWLLAASYFQRGYKLGYFPRARFHHYYSGSLSELKTFTLDFVTGEAGYFNGEHDEVGSHLFEIPPEWIYEGNFDRDMARAVLHIAVQSLIPLGRPFRDVARSAIQVGRWLPPAIFGGWVVRVSASTAAIYARIALLLAVAIGSRNWLNCRFRKYIAALIHVQRLAIIEMQRRTGRDTIQPGHVGFGLDAPTLNVTGFYPLEQFQGSQFRWSETAAAVLVFAFAGLQKIRIDCIPVRDLLDVRDDFRFFIDGVRIPSSQLSIETDRITIEFDKTRPQIVTLGWTCRPFVAVADPRQLGLAIKRIDLVSDPVTTDASSKLLTALAS